ESNAKRISILGEYLLDRIKMLEFIVPYTSDGSSGIIAFNIRGKDSAQVCDRLNDYGFCVRGGLHCAPLLHKHYGTTKTGMVRVSLGIDNTFSEIDFLINTLNQLIKT
ncbi:MAG: aminotransferase class V-fold PLP-dependent enzyme, partial [Clostridia bacterium]|nr:aminotransferase class V-fold PLP-dependent enzyme [Clostridia bacterium]